MRSLSTPLLTASEVAALFAVDAATVIRWAQSGRVNGWQTPSGQWRFIRSEIEKHLPDEIKQSETEKT